MLIILGDVCSALGILYIVLCMMGGSAALWQICLGVFISSAFSALLEPSYRATITDLLTKEEYSKASGLVSPAGSARCLISPILAGALLAVSSIKLLLMDIAFSKTQKSRKLLSRPYLKIVKMTSSEEFFLWESQFSAGILGVFQGKMAQHREKRPAVWAF